MSTSRKKITDTDKEKAIYTGLNSLKSKLIENWATKEFRALKKIEVDNLSGGYKETLGFLIGKYTHEPLYYHKDSINRSYGFKSIFCYRDSKTDKTKLEIIPIQGGRSSIKREIDYQALEFEESFIKMFDIKIISSEISAKVWGLKEVKAGLEGSIIKAKDYNIIHGTSDKLGTSSYFITVPHPRENKQIKFCICDIEFLPPIVKGWNFPKDKTLKINDKVYIKKDKDKRVWTISFIVAGADTQKINRNSNTGKKDIVIIQHNNITKKVFANLLKKVE